jgi:hypothetical protein
MAVAIPKFPSKKMVPQLSPLSHPAGLEKQKNNMRDGYLLNYLTAVVKWFQFSYVTLARFQARELSTAL